MHTAQRCILLAAAAGGLAFAPASLAAQEPAETIPEQERPTTHTVVRGDNLWDLSQRYLGNPFLWPEIYRLNRDIIEDPHWIYPGEVLRLPGAQEEVVAELPPEPVPPAEVVVVPEAQTAFPKLRPRMADSSRGFPTGTVGVQPRPTVRPGEVIAAPYVDREGGPRSFGRILKSGDIAGIAQASERFIFQAYDRIFIAPPPGYVAAEGERYLAYRLGPVLENQGQVVIPTGIIEVTRAARADVAAGARVVREFAEVSLDDRLIPIDTAGIGTTIRPVAVDDGPATEITWIYGEPVLPNVQNFVVLRTTSRNGVRMGDEFLIYQPGTRATDERLGDPEIPIAKAQVVRATPFGVTAVVIGQEQPAIREGMNARVIARMP